MMFFGGGWIAAILGIVIHAAFAVMIVMAAIWLFRALFSGAEQIAGSRKAEIYTQAALCQGGSIT